MKFILLFIMIFSSLLFAKTSENNTTKVKSKVKTEKKVTKDSNTTKAMSQTQKQIKIEIEREKKFAREQKFYFEKDYDFEGSKVNMESVKRLKEPENLDYFDMDSVYD